MRHKEELKVLGCESVKWIKVANDRIECQTSRICWTCLLHNSACLWFGDSTSGAHV